MSNLNNYQITTLKKIGFKDTELQHFTPSEAQNTIKKFFKMSKRLRGQTKDQLRRA
jgi:hypothetical protein